MSVKQGGKQSKHHRRRAGSNRRARQRQKKGGGGVLRQRSAVKLPLRRQEIPKKLSFALEMQLKPKKFRTHLPACSAQKFPFITCLKQPEEQLVAGKCVETIRIVTT